MADIGFIGLGPMGGTMSRNLVQAGHGLRVYDLDAGAVAALLAEGAEAAPPFALRCRCRIVHAVAPGR